MPLRKATADDEATIKKLVRGAGLDPTKILWQNFVVAEEANEIVAIGQIRHHADCLELGSMVTLKAYRGRGLARSIIAELEKEAGRPLYLFCPTNRQTFYEQSGYQVIGYWNLPRSLRWKALIPLVFRIVGIRIITMVKY